MDRVCRNAKRKLHNPFMQRGFFYLISLDRAISSNGVSSKFLLLPWFTEILVLNANSVVPDQTPRSAASDLGLHCLPEISPFLGRQA